MSESLSAREMNDWFAHFKLSAEERKKAQEKAEQRAKARQGAKKW